MRSLVYQSSLKALEAAEGEDSEVEGEAVDKRLAAVAVEALVAEVADWVAAEVAVEAADWEAVEAEDSLRDVTRPAGNSADQSKLAIGGSEESLGTGDVTCNGYFDDKLLLTRPRRAPMRMRFESGTVLGFLSRSCAMRIPDETFSDEYAAATSSFEKSVFRSGQEAAGDHRRDTVVARHRIDRFLGGRSVS